MRAASAILVVTAVACSGKPTKVGRQPSWRDQGTEVRAETGDRPASPLAEKITFAPDSPASTSYGGPPTAAPKSALGDAVTASLAAAAKAAGRPAPVADGRLFTAAAELAAAVPDEGVLSYAMVEFAMQRQGVIEPAPFLLVAWGSADDPAGVVEQLAPSFPDLLPANAAARFGVGAARRASGEDAIVFTLQASAVTIKPIARAWPRGGTIRVEGKVAAPFKDPVVLVTHETGAVVRMPSGGRSANDFTAAVDCAGRTGPQQIEVAAADATGSTVLANFPVWCNQDAPAAITVQLDAADAPVRDAAEAEERLLALANRDRDAAGLPPLLWDDRVAEVARAHSREMHATGVVAHVSPTTGSAADRTKAAGIKTAVVLENIARAQSPGQAHIGLMNSPGHRANLLSGVATHVGIGVVIGGKDPAHGELFATQVFILIPPKVTSAAASAAIRDKLAEVRRFDTDPMLESLAQKLADQLAAGQTPATAIAATRAQLQKVSKLARVGSVITAVPDLATVSGAALLGTYAPDVVGIGAAQGTHPEIGEGAIWVVVLFGNRR
jgi:uncharacterized protein YkwD